MDIKLIIENYVDWVRDNTFTRKVSDDDHYAITTPFLDTRNDHIDIYVKRINGNKFLFSDDGYTLADLRMVGTDVFSTDKRKKIFETTLNRYGVKLVGNELTIEADISNIGAKKHSLLQSVIAVNDMYVMSHENVASFFKEDVALYFSAHDVFFTQDVKLPGKTGFDHSIDFLVPKSRTRPERLIQAINSPRKDHITSTIFAFDDISAIRDTEMSKLVVYNDEEKTISSDVQKALQMYEIEALGWSNKDEIIERMALV
jgi:hypothetical protein